MDHKASIKNIQEHILGSTQLNTNYGRLEFDAAVDYKKRNEYRYKRCLLVCFQLKIYVFEIEKKKIDDPETSIFQHYIEVDISFMILHQLVY